MKKKPGSPLLKAPGGRRSGSQTGLGSLAGRVEGGGNGPQGHDARNSMGNMVNPTMMSQQSR